MIVNNHSRLPIFESFDQIFHDHPKNS